MKITVIHGQAHQRNTYHLTQLLLEQLDHRKMDVTEFKVNGISQCVGCFQCILKDENLCPHREQMEPIIQSLEAADVIILASPNYVMGMTGQLKSFCDHMAYRWIVHRPYGKMKNKIGVAISTTAGAGAKKATKDMATQFRWWAVGKIYELPFTVAASSWDEVNHKKRARLKKKVKRLGRQINAKSGNVKPGIKSRLLFYMMGKMQKRMGSNPVDITWWETNGWIKTNRT